MPDIALTTELFDGAVTSAGVDFGSWVQQAQTGAGAVKAFYRDGGGYLKQSGIVSAPCYITQPLPYVGFMPAGTLEEVYEIRFVWDASFDSNTTFRVCARFLPGSSYLSGAHQGGYYAEIKGGSIRVGIDNVSDNVYYEFFTPTNGHEYILQLRLKTHAADSTNLAARYADASAPTTWIATYAANVVNDSTAAYNNASAQYSWGMSAEGSAYVKSAWAIGEAQLLKSIADVAGPVLGAGQVHPSGTCFSVAVTDDYMQPVLPAYGVTGLTFQARATSGDAWSSFATVGPIEISQDTTYAGRITGGFAAPLPAGWLIRYTYAGGNITDSDAAFNPASTATNVSLTNNSIHSTTATSTKGTMFLMTRGMAGVIQSSSTNLRGTTLHRQEMPYGASANWVVDYPGYADGSTVDTIGIRTAAVWIQQSQGEPRFRVPITFNSGSAGCTIVHDTIQSSDAIPVPLLPGAIVWSTQDYMPGDSATGLPHQLWLYVKESSSGLEDFDGTYSQARAGVVDKTLTGGFNHTELSGPFNTQSYCCRGYRPMSIVGKPHPSFTGTEIVPCWIGDSINIRNDDFSPQTNAVEEYRGWNGRYTERKHPDMTYGKSGSGFGGFVAEVGSVLFVRIFGTAGVGRKVTHLVDEYGINTIRNDNSASALWADRLTVAAIAATNGVKYIQTCLTPCGASNLTGTAASAGIASFIVQRGLFNDQVRAQSNDTIIPGCVGYIDPNEKLETDHLNNTNVPVAGNTAGYLHPNSTEHALGATCIRPALFTGNPNPISSINSFFVTVTTVGTGNLVSWTTSSSASYYRVLRAPTKFGVYVDLSTVAAPTLTYTDSSPISSNFYAVIPVP